MDTSRGLIGGQISAINLALKFDGDYEAWEARAIDGTSRGEGEAVVRVKQNGHHVSAVDKGYSVDAASVDAYLAAVNLIRRIEKRRAQH